VVDICIESWAAIAPGLETKQDWGQWLKQSRSLSDGFSKQAFKPIPPMLRRRLSTLGRCAVSSALMILDKEDSIPSIFSSKYGDTGISLSLLAEMGRGEAMSPTDFSLAVHNAVGGLFSIVRKDTSKLTSICATEGLVVNSLLEAVGQLQDEDRVLCVIYDIPLPELYQRYCDSDAFPYAIAMILNKTAAEQVNIQQVLHVDQVNTGQTIEHTQLSEPLQLINMLLGFSDEISTESKGITWKLTRTVSDDVKQT